MFEFLKKIIHGRDKIVDSKCKNDEKSKTSLLISMQDCAVDFLVKKQFFPDSACLLTRPSHSIMKAKINGKNALIYVRAVMYPENMNSHGREHCIESLETYSSRSDLVSCDLYYWGIGLIQKNAPEEEKGVYKIGKTYQMALGDLTLLRKRDSERYGYCAEDPIKLSMVSDEYFYMEHMVSKFGTVKKYGRIGSCDFPGRSKPVDQWRVLVETDDSVEMIQDIYLDPYAFSPTDPNKKIIPPDGFEFVK